MALYKKINIPILIIMLGLLLSIILTKKTYGAITKNTPIVTTKGTNFYIGDEEFRFVGTNNYYLHYKDELMITSLLDDAKTNGFNVIRMWGFLDGSSTSVYDNKAWMQSSQGNFTKPSWADNDFVSGWDRMDFAVSEAAKRGIRLIIVLTNYWDDFGGIEEYVNWYNQKYGYTRFNPDFARKKDFYSNEEIKGYYKEYISYLISRTNQYNNRKYSEDPTIFSWELMNEPRNPYLDGGNITDVTLWADEMSTFIKEELDNNHMIALGDEGSFYNRSEWDYKAQAQHLYNGSEGVDFEAVLALDNIDFGTFHLYPESWGINFEHMEWGRNFIINHLEVGKTLNKPVILEEFGISANLGRNRELIYQDWIQTVYENDGAGVLFWMFAGIDTSENNEQGYYPDYDGYRLANISNKYPELDVLIEYSKLFSGAQVEFQDKIYIIEPYTTSDTLAIESEKYENELYPISVNVNSYTNVLKVEMYLDDELYRTLAYNPESNNYEGILNLRHLNRGSDVNLDFVAYNTAGKIYSKTITLTRMLKFDYFVETTYDFNENYLGDGVQFGYYGVYNAIFESTSWVSTNNGMVRVSANYDRDHFWSEVKLEVLNLPVKTLLDNYALSYDVYFEKDKLVEGVLKPTDEAYDTAPGFRHYAAIDPGWAKIGLNENNIKYHELEEVNIDGITYLKQHIYIPYNTNPNQSKLVIGIVTNHLLYDGDFLIDNLLFYNRKLSSDALREDDYLDWILDKETKRQQAKQQKTIFIISLASGGVLVLFGGMFIILKLIKRK